MFDFYPAIAMQMFTPWVMWHNLLTHSMAVPIAIWQIQMQQLTGRPQNLRAKFHE